MNENDFLKNLQALIKKKNNEIISIPKMYIEQHIGMINKHCIEFEDFKIILSSVWKQKICLYCDYWSLDKDFILLELLTRCYCLLKGKPLSETDLPMPTAFTKVMYSENLLKGIEYQYKLIDLFGIYFSKSEFINDYSPKLVSSPLV